MTNRVEFFVPLIAKEGVEVDQAIQSIRKQVNEWLTREPDIEIKKMYMSVIESYPVFWIWYEQKED